MISAILTADMHLRDTCPSCRNDPDFLLTQMKKLKWLAGLADSLRVPILDAGDIFDSYRPPNRVLATAISILRDVQMFSVPGNHDLPKHSMSLLENSGFHVLESAHAIVGLEEAVADDTSLTGTVFGCPWGCKMPCPERPGAILLYHGMVWEGHPPFPGAEGLNVKQLAADCGKLGYRLVVSGHNHQTFQYKDPKTGCLVVNPGSFSRQSYAEREHVPVVGLWDETANTVQWRPVPLDKSVEFQSEYADKRDEEGRIGVFVSRLKKSPKLTVSFRKNMEDHLAANRSTVKPETRKIVEECLS